MTRERKKQAQLLFCLMTITLLRQCSGWDGAWVVNVGAFSPWLEIRFHNGFGLIPIFLSLSVATYDFHINRFLINLIGAAAVVYLFRMHWRSDAVVTGIFRAYLIFQLVWLIPLTQVFPLFAWGKILSINITKNEQYWFMSLSFFAIAVPFTLLAMAVKKEKTAE